MKKQRRLAEANLRLQKYCKALCWTWYVIPGSDSGRKLGLIKAVEKFDYHKGFKFSNFMLRGGSDRLLREQILRSGKETIRIPVHMVETINKLIRVSRQLLQELGREPTPEEIAAKLDMPVERVREILKISQEPVSLET